MTSNDYQESAEYNEYQEYAESMADVSGYFSHVDECHALTEQVFSINRIYYGYMN